MIVGQLALTLSALFTGAAVYVNVAEQPARLSLDDASLLAEWRSSYKHAALMQATLALVGGVLGVAAFFISHDWRWLLGDRKLALHARCDPADKQGALNNDA